jgi:glutaredoxin
MRRLFGLLMTKATTRQVWILAVMNAGLLLGCSQTSAPEEPEATVDSAAALPIVSDERTDLIFSWFGDGGAQMASSVAEVPGEARKTVRVQDPGIPPEKRDPSMVYLANLSAKGPDGKYLVRAVKREQYMARHQPQRQNPPAAQPDGNASTQPGSSGDVVMYATRHCPVCKTARRWLLDNKIPYVEKDVERDQAAARELAQKAMKQGFSPSGVPVFDVRGRLLPGFDRVALKALLRDSAPPVQNPI